MNTAKNSGRSANFEEIIREYLKQGRNKLMNELPGTREAIRLVANEKMRDFMKTTDKGLDRYERNYLTTLIIACMYQAFCYGYGIGKMEGSTKSNIFL